MFVLTLGITDSEDAGYFTNKTLNKLHGYIRHQHVKLAIFFTFSSIKIYASEKTELEDLLQNEALSFDIKRHIFSADLQAVSDTEIRVYKRMHDTIHSVKKKVNKRLGYYKKHFSLSDDALKKIQIERIKQYEKKQQQQQDRRYFIIKNKDKRFTIWLEVRLLNVADFDKTEFNSYGLLKVKEKPCWSKSND